MKLLHLLLSLSLILPAAPVAAAVDYGQAMPGDAAMQADVAQHDCCDDEPGSADVRGCCQDSACGHCIVMLALPVRVQFMRPASPDTRYPALAGGPVTERQFAPPYRPPCA